MEEKFVGNDDPDNQDGGSQGKARGREGPSCMPLARFVAGHILILIFRPLEPLPEFVSPLSLSFFYVPLVPSGSS